MKIKKQNLEAGVIYTIIGVAILVGGILLLVVIGNGGAGGVLGSDANSPSGNYTEADLPPVVDGVQKVAVTVNNTSYSPKTTVLKQGVPTELTFLGQGYGCSTAIVSRNFWNGVLFVDYGGQETVKFTPEKTGKFKYACTMGMYTGWIEVI